MSGIGMAAHPTVTGDSQEASARTEASVGLPKGTNPVSFLQAQLVAYIVVFACSGLVPVEDFGTAVFISFYAIGLSRWVFPVAGNTDTPPLVDARAWLPAYIAMGSVIGLFLPLAYVFGGFTRGDQQGVQAATPPLFLLCCQLLTENVVLQFPWISLPVRALVLLFYSARRLVTVSTWMRFTIEAGPKPFFCFQDIWKLAARLLALANLTYFGINLFVFVVPLFLPRAFEHWLQVQGKVSPKQGAPEKKGSNAKGAAKQQLLENVKMDRAI